MFNHNPAAPTAGGFKLLPDGGYDLKIVNTEEKKSQKGFPMVKVSCEVINNADYNGSKIIHNVTFLPKETNGKPTPGAGMSTHFIKTINQPWEGDEVTVDPIAWVGETFHAKIGTREYENKAGVKVKSNDIKEVSPSEEVAF